MRRLTTAVATAALALSLVGCDAAAERLAEEAAEAVVPGDTEIDVDDEGGVSIETDDGNLQITGGEGAELPEGFPAEVPLPDDYTVASSTSFSDETGDSFMITLQVPGLDAGWIESDAIPALESAGFTINGQGSNTVNGVASSNVQAEDGTRLVNLAIIAGQDDEPVYSIQIFPVE